MQSKERNINDNTILEETDSRIGMEVNMIEE